MANKPPKPEENILKFWQVEVLMGQGVARLDAIRQIGVVQQTYYHWRKHHTSPLCNLFFEWTHNFSSFGGS